MYAQKQKLPQYVNDWFVKIREWKGKREKTRKKKEKKTREEGQRERGKKGVKENREKEQEKT